MHLELEQAIMCSLPLSGSLFNRVIEVDLKDIFPKFYIIYLAIDL